MKLDLLFILMDSSSQYGSSAVPYHLNILASYAGRNTCIPLVQIKFSPFRKS